MSKQHVRLEAMAAGRRGSIQESRELFNVLGRIQNLLSVADHEGRQSLVYEALGLIEESTENIRWRNETASRLSPQDPRRRNEKWEVGVLNDFNANLARSKDTKDHIHLGNTYVRSGMYGEALSAYSSSAESLLLNSHLGVFQRNWMYVITALAKVFVGDEARMSTELKLNLALAYWYTHDYANCMALLLHLDVAELGEDSSCIWLSCQNVRSMLIVCVLLELDRDSLEFFEAADPLAQHLKISGIVTAFVNFELSSFWDMIETELDLPTMEDDTSLAVLADEVKKKWLSVHNQVPLEDVLAQFRKATAHTGYSAADLVSDLCKWDAPYKVDFVEGRVIYAESKPDTRATAATLAYEFRRDSLALLWGKRRQSQEFLE